MKAILVTPRADAGVKRGPDLNRTERRLRGRGTTFTGQVPESGRT
jgi:hypothetical protein